MEQLHLIIGFAGELFCRLLPHLCLAVLGGYAGHFLAQIDIARRRKRREAELARRLQRHLEQERADWTWGLR